MRMHGDWTIGGFDKDYFWRFCTKPKKAYQYMQIRKAREMQDVVTDGIALGKAERKSICLVMVNRVIV